MSVDRKDFGRLPGVRRRSRKTDEARRRGLPQQHAVADDRSGEGEGQVGAPVGLGFSLGPVDVLMDMGWITTYCYRDRALVQISAS